MGKTRDKILNRINDGTPTEIVDIPGWDLKVLVKGQTAGSYIDMVQGVRDKDGEVDTAKLTLRTIMETVYDPDSDELLFDPADYDTLKKAPYQVITTLQQAAARVNGLTATERDLSETPTEDS